MTTYGYMRVSTDKQENASQLDALVLKIPRESIYEDTISGKTTSRPGLNALLEKICPGDTILVWKLDRLGRNSAHVIATVDMLHERGIKVESLTETIDVRTPMGVAHVGFMAVLSRLERETIAQRVRAGMAAAIARGKHCGRPRDPAPWRDQAQVLLKKHSIRKTADTLGVSRGKIERFRKEMLAT